MDKLYYCVNCRRIFGSSDECMYCSSYRVKELCEKAPVNVIGTKVKGIFLKSTGMTAKILISDSKQQKMMKEIDASKIRKIL